jgi:hypothetical protein
MRQEKRTVKRLRLNLSVMADMGIEILDMVRDEVLRRELGTSGCGGGAAERPHTDEGRKRSEERAGWRG